MEFISFDEAVDALADLGIYPDFPDEAHLRFEPDPDQLPEDACFLHLADAGCDAASLDGARRITLPKDDLAGAVESMIGVLRLAQVLVFPVGKWRTVFDAVAFSMASDEHWQEVDAMASVELNTRDPLLCEPGDYHTLRRLVGALLSDAESPDQGITITTTGAPLLVEVVPQGALRVMLGNQALADEVTEALHI
ncbi:MAG: hypothetical protein HRU76_06120 [Phycisphaeraceae bacterium]|nr:hypothetical protein [Phycisphaerales bacterium]QOJ17176.1 MAG: hypothetical protein HRU76_06120 [Phycisphaeraceae bacterium]